MARKKDRSPEEIARREKIRELLQLANVGSMDDIHELFKETIGEFMENGLEAELDEELGYNRYDYRNKTTDNSRNGHSSKKLKTSYGEIEIETHVRDIYGLEVSDSTISRVTDKILPVVKDWQNRPLEPIYAVVFLDAIHYHVRIEGQVVKKAVYIAIGINLDGRKDVLGMWVGENESAKYWATVLC